MVQLVECVSDLQGDDAREHIPEAVEVVQRVQPAKIVHIFVVQLGQRLVHRALCEARLLLQPRAELLVFVFVCGKLVGCGAVQRDVRRLCDAP